MARGVKYTRDEVAQRLAQRGYLLLGEYSRKDRPTLMRCPVHGFECATIPNNIFQGGFMQCCGMEARREKLRATQAGTGNNFYGRKHSILSREKMSASTRLEPGFGVRGVAHPDYDHKRDADARRGVPRPKEVSAKLSAYMKRRHENFAYCHRKAVCGKTKGKPGIFYIVRINGELKFGSATTTMAYRLTRMRQKYPDASLVLHCLVPDAGDYEAAMMERHRQHWLHGEFFKDFLT